MRVKELIKALQDYVEGDGDEYDQVKIWLPGSSISLQGMMTFNENYDALLIEGNLDPGSALGED